MNLTVDINYTYTDAAEAAVANAGSTTTARWQTSDLGTTPQKGDLVAFGEDPDCAVFIVHHRLFQWRKPDHLLIQIALDILRPPAAAAGTPAPQDQG